MAVDFVSVHDEFHAQLVVFCWRVVGYCSEPRRSELIGKGQQLD